MLKCAVTSRYGTPGGPHAPSPALPPQDCEQSQRTLHCSPQQGVRQKGLGDYAHQALPTHVWKLSEKPGEKPRQPGQIVLASSSTFWDHGFAVETCKREASWWLSACVHFVSAATSEDHTEFSDQSFRLCYQRMWCRYPQMESV